METKSLIKGLHHVTATVNDAQEDYDFYVKVLGLRLVKKTVNFDNNQVYHFYYGTQTGTPSTIFTTFPYKNQGVRQGVEGTGMISSTTFSVPSTALAFWNERLADNGVHVEERVKFGKALLWFRDPSGLQIELMADDADRRLSYPTPDIDLEVGIRGIHHVTLAVAPEDWNALMPLLLAELNMTHEATEGNCMWLNVNEGGAGNVLLLDKHISSERGKNGIGTVHHVAWRVENETALRALRHRLADELGLQVTEVKDRNYFRSIYFRLPSHQLFEVATIPPGFTVDEAENELGTHLMLPEWEEVNRTQIEAVLPKLI
jgi:glyoxalase family protein